MNLQQALELLPNTEKNVVSVLSGGLDSTIMTHLLSEKYGKDRVFALTFDYKQKQRAEINLAAGTCETIQCSHTILNLSILGDIVKGVSANIEGTNVSMPTIKDVLGDPQPKTYVPFRNMILNSIAFSFAESRGASHIFTGLQVHDEYGYWDTTQRFVDAMNAVAIQNRSHQVEMIAPFSHLSKYEEILIAQELGGVDFSSTLTCYNPTELMVSEFYGGGASRMEAISCGKCPSCAERIMNFAKAGIVDPIRYAITIDWSTLIKKHGV